MSAETVRQFDQSVLAALADRIAIVDMGYRFLWAIDARQWDSLSTYCDPEIIVKWEDPTALPRLFNGLAKTVEGLQSLFGATATHHQATNEMLEVNGESAVLRWLVAGRYRAPTMRGTDWCTAYAGQRVTLNRSNGHWKIYDLHHSNLWVEGNPAILQAAPLSNVPESFAVSVSERSANETQEQRLARLADINAIHDVMMRFGRGLDRKDWRLYRSCFGARLTLDFSRMTGEPAQEVDADLFVEFARTRQRSHTAFHQYSNFQVNIRGDRADCILYMVARHRVSESGYGDPLNVFIGWYENEFLRSPDGWKISVLRTPLQWVEGNALIKDKSDPAVEEISRRLFAKKENS